MSPNKYIKDEIEDFWSQKANKILKEKTAILLAGNGLTCLAIKSSPSLDNWIEQVWNKIIKNGIKFDYAKFRGLTLPECLNFLFSEATDEEAEKTILKAIWEKTETNTEESILHQKCLETCQIIITTNYDTLFERSAKNDFIVLDFLEDNFHGSITFENSKKYIIKLHGSFHNRDYKKNQKVKYDTFDEWYTKYNNKEIKLIATFKEYQDNIDKLSPKIDKFCNSFANDKFLIAMGHGLAPQDFLVYNLIQYFNKRVVGFTFGGNEIERYRFENQWGIQHCNVSGKRTEYGDKTRYKAHSIFIESISNCLKESEARETTTQRAILIGESAFCTYLPLENNKEIRRESFCTVKDPFEMVIGHMLTPAIFLDSWNVPSTLASVIGYDEMGYKIKERLKKTINIDWVYLTEKHNLKTINDWILLQGGTRTIFYDGELEQNKGNMQESLQGVTKDIESNNLKPTIIYLSRHCGNISDELSKWKTKLIGEGSPLIVFDTLTDTKEPFEEKKLYEHVDIVIGSSLYTVRIGTFPIRRKYWFLKIFDIPKDEKDYKKWDRYYETYCNKIEESRIFPLQHKIFIEGLCNLTFNDIKQRLSNFAQHVEWWITTLGEYGMVAIRIKDDNVNPSIFWVPALPITPHDMKNPSGCGDVARAAFLAYYHLEYKGKINDFLGSAVAIKKAVKMATVAGSMKAKYFKYTHRDALKRLEWETLENESNKINITEGFENVRKALKKELLKQEKKK